MSTAGFMVTTFVHTPVSRWTYDQPTSYVNLTGGGLMKILIMGAGFVGTATAVSFAQTGHKVVCFDTDAEKIKSLSRGEPVFFEPGLKEALSVQLEQSNLRFSVHAQQAIEESEVIFICVGTPSTDEGGADLSYVKAAAMTIGRHMNGYKLIVNKSTVPVATCRKIRDWVVKGQTTPYPFDVASNPEFLREGNALADALSPHRIVVGSTTERCTALVKQLYKSFHCPLVLTDPATAEFIKYAANSFLATKISYMNELARFCDELGVSIQDVAHGIGLDPRIGGEFLRAGIGYGGSCFPKDVKALLHMANEHGIRMSILEQVKHVNETQYLYLLDKINREAGELRGGVVAVLGISFKPNTSDTRESPALSIIKHLADAGANVRVHDPKAILPTGLHATNVQQCETPDQACEGADVIIICTDWPEYKEQVDWAYIKSMMRGSHVFDGRNMLDPKMMHSLGFSYIGIGL